ncbi:hypothetical protein RDABS01_021693, partial [Bienertia sinuspersici]
SRRTLAAVSSFKLLSKEEKRKPKRPKQLIDSRIQFSILVVRIPLILMLVMVLKPKEVKEEEILMLKKENLHPKDLMKI